MGWLSSAPPGRKLLNWELHLSQRSFSSVSLIGLEQDGWRFLVDDVPTTSAEVVRWGRWPGIVGQSAVWLADGSWLAGDLQVSPQGNVLLQHRWLEVPEIPAAAVRALVVTPVASLAEWLRLIRQIASRQVSRTSFGWRPESVVGHNRLVQPGRLRSPIAEDSGGWRATIHWLSANRCDHQSGLAGTPPGHRRCMRMGLEDGTLLNATAIVRRSDRLAVKVLPLPELLSLDSIDGFVTAIRYLGTDELPGVQYLSQLEPVSYRFMGDSELSFPLGVNQSVYGRPLVVGRRSRQGVVFNGLAIHSSARAAFAWDGSPAKLLAEVRLAETEADQARLGDAVCKVWLARGDELQLAEEFALVREPSGAGQHLVDLDITDARLVVLTVEKGARGQWGDEVYWLNARLSRY